MAKRKTKERESKTTNIVDYEKNILGQLDEKQLLFLDYYTKGIECKKAMELAGYSPSYIKKTHKHFLEGRLIQMALAELNSDVPLLKIKMQNEAIKDFWLNTMKNTSITMQNRLKASENLAKANGMFTTQVEINGNVQHNLNNNTQSYEALSTEQLLKLIEATEDKEEENKIEEVEFEEIDKEEEEETNIFVKEND